MSSIQGLDTNVKRLVIVKSLSIVLVILFSNAAITDVFDSNSHTTDVIAESEDLDLGYFDGYNLFVLGRSLFSDNSILDIKIMMTDMNNNTVLEKNIPSLGIFADIEFYNSTTLIFGDMGTTQLWNFETDTIIDLGFSGHHDVEANYLNNTILTFEKQNIYINARSYFYDLINEYALNGTLIRTLNTTNYVQPWQTCPFEDLINSTIDVTHANSIVYDEDDNALYLNCRNPNTFYKIDYTSGDLIWGLGEYGNFTMYDINGNEREHLFFHCHTVEKVGSNRFVLLDNDFHNQTNAINNQARFLEITIDELNMVANVTREWICPTEYWSPIWGDCNLLPNDNFLGTLGQITNEGQNVGSKLIEVNTKGDIVWILESPIEKNIRYTVYRSERFRFTPIVSEPRVIESENSTLFEWDVWYNFKSKTSFTGKYHVYLDNQLVTSNDIVFPKYWQSMQIQYNLTDLTPGRHEIKLVVEDDWGHRSDESEFFEGSYEFGTGLETEISLESAIGIPMVIAVIFCVRSVRRRKLR